MSVAEMRAALKKQYNGAPGWICKVNKMSDNQIIAIYFRLLRTGDLRKNR